MAKFDSQFTRVSIYRITTKQTKKLRIERNFMTIVIIFGAIPNRVAVARSIVNDAHILFQLILMTLE